MEKKMQGCCDYPMCDQDTSGTNWAGWAACLFLGILCWQISSLSCQVQSMQCELEKLNADILSINIEDLK